jgi:Virulence-associated protein E/Bifunctional DNA primase/polymerase, N-terminal/Primase C terminal 2 (PriCT-2)
MLAARARMEMKTPTAFVQPQGSSGGGQGDQPPLASTRFPRELQGVTECRSTSIYGRRMSSEMLEAALAYARMGLRVFPLHTIVNGACSCGKATCSSAAKHPKTKRGFLDATTDAEQIRKWWARWPNANIGIATGSGLAVIDIDGAEGAQEFKELVATHGPPPATLTCQTGSGFHLFYLLRAGSPEVRSSARGKVHVRGEGGYVVAAPSRHASGRTYQWVKKVPIAILPDWLRQWTQGYDVPNQTAKQPGAFNFGVLPAYLQRSQIDIDKKLETSLKQQRSPAEEARLVSALSSIPANTYETWFQCGMACKDLGWERSDGTDIGFDIWVAWSETCAEKFSLAACESKWQSFKRTGVSVGTIYHLAQKHGWNPAPAPVHLNGHADPTALPAAFLAAQAGAIVFPDTTEEGRPKPTCTNANVAIAALGIQCRKDLFHEKMLVGGHAIQQWAGDLSDDVIHVIRKIIRFRYGFDPNKQNTTDACVQLCLEHQFDPVCDYLDGLAWDGTPRLDRWLTAYMGAQDTELNRTIGRLALVAAVRRVRQPGAKFDQIVVLEGPEGKGKSMAIEILAGRENFSDGKILGLGDREQQEQTAGVWLYEIAELTGMRKAEIEHVKAFASRTVDRARPAYGRFRVDRPRRTIFFATTNRDDYLQSDTGNRRFWPVPTSTIDLDGLRRDRDQLWAEAAVHEARGDSITLPERLWSVAAEKQNERLEGDEWFELIARWLAEKSKVDVSVTEVLSDNQYLRREPGVITRGDAMRVGTILKRLHYFRYSRRVAGGHMWRYRRSV